MPDACDLDLLPDDEDTVVDHPVHLMVSAANTPRPATIAPRSVFELATVDLLKVIRLSRPSLRTQTKPAPPWERTRFKISREAGVTRRVVVPHHDTEEWRQYESARRARQRPPKPSRAAKTMGKRLRELVGAG